jgi:hypothetical protein
MSQLLTVTELHAKRNHKKHELYARAIPFYQNFKGSQKCSFREMQYLCAANIDVDSSSRNSRDVRDNIYPTRKH